MGWLRWFWGFHQLNYSFNAIICNLCNSATNKKERRSACHAYCVGWADAGSPTPKARHLDFREGLWGFEECWAFQPNLRTGLQVCTIASLKDLLDYLATTADPAQQVHEATIKAYRDRYGM